MKGFYTFLMLLLFSLLYFSCTIQQRLPKYIYQEDPQVVFYSDSVMLSQPKMTWTQAGIWDYEIRPIIQRNWQALFHDEAYRYFEGTIVTKVCFDQQGKAVRANISGGESDPISKNQEKIALNTALGYQISVGDSADAYQCGELKFHLDVNSKIK